MSKIIAFIRLDLLTIKPYLKTVWFIVLLGLILSLSQKNPYAVAGIYMAYAILVVSYPFAVEDKNNLHLLYSTLSIQRGRTVLGRYATSMVLFGGVICLSVPFAFALSLYMRFPLEWEILLGVYTVGFLFFSLTLSIQLPIYFKMGYTRGKIIAMIPLMLMILLISTLNDWNTLPMLGNLMKKMNLLLEANKSLIYLLPLLAGTLILYFSYLVSLRLYTRREL